MPLSGWSSLDLRLASKQIATTTTTGWHDPATETTVRWSNQKSWDGCRADLQEILDCPCAPQLMTVIQSQHENANWQSIKTSTRTFRCKKFPDR